MTNDMHIISFSVESFDGVELLCNFIYAHSYHLIHLNDRIGCKPKVGVAT